MGMAWRQFLDQLENQKHNQALHFLDYLIHSQSFWKKRALDASDAGGLLDELENAIVNMEIPIYLKSLLKSDITKLRYILQNCEKFGEQDYWSKFQKMTGLFGSIYTTLDTDAREQAAPVLNKMIRRVVATVSVSADLTQLAPVAFGLLPKV